MAIIDNPFETKNYYEAYLNKQSAIFRGHGINGNIELGNNVLLDIEDPTYLVFDINIDDSDTSPLFNSFNLLNGHESIANIPFRVIDKKIFPNPGTGALNFIRRYGVYDYEIEAASYTYAEFIRTLRLIFPGLDSKDAYGNQYNSSGSKRHYISSIGGLDVLNKKILDFPNDKITIKLTEDVTMLTQYLSELYLGLTYSYATNRQLIPSNLLRFDMYIILSDVRDMKFGKVKKDKTLFAGYIDKIVENKSKFLYVLHDCEFDFTTSKIHTDEVVNGGFNNGPTTTPSNMDLNIVFKSYSRILIPALMENSSKKDAYILDYKLKNEGFKYDAGKNNPLGITVGLGGSLGPKKISTKNKIQLTGEETVQSYMSIYDRFNNDYLKQSEFSIKTKRNQILSGVDDTDTIEYGPAKVNDDYLKKLGKSALNQAKGLGSSMLNMVGDQGNKLVNNLQKGISGALGINLTVNKINVYFETPEEKVERMALMITNLANKTANAVQNTITDNLENGGKYLKSGKNAQGMKEDILKKNFGSAWKSIGNDLNGLVSGTKIKQNLGESLLNNDSTLDDNGNIYGMSVKDSYYTRSGVLEPYITDRSQFNDSVFNDKTPSKDPYNINESSPYLKSLYDKYGKTYTENITDDLYSSNLYEDDKSVKEQYVDKNGKTVVYFEHHNNKYPEGDLMETGEYNEKYPEGDVHSDGKYNEKYPEGDVHETGEYNEKYPDGDVHEDGKYNEKYPKGDVHETGIYNEKYPDGDVHETGEYNEKYPEGDVHETSEYNQKYPEGDVHETGIYNKKYPEGDVHEDGKYNQKFPKDDVHKDGQYNEKYPEGDVHETGIYNEKYPEGDLMETGKYNEKYPDGDVHKDGQYNEKYPEGDVHSDSKYNEKYPEGDLMNDGQYNQKYPEGDVHQNGKYNEKYPEGDVHENGVYNEKYPQGDVHSDSQYNQKYPEGDLMNDGQYNEKYPEGDLMNDGQYNQKYPEGDLMNDGQYNQKYPSGDVHKKGKYNQKYPEGDLMNDGQYNIKFPSGDVHPDGKYNEKYPEGDLMNDGKHNQKYPEGDLMNDGKHNKKFPNGAVYGEYIKKNNILNDNNQHNAFETSSLNLHANKDAQTKINFSEEILTKDSLGNLNEDYNPLNDRHPDGKYNQKYPTEGNVYLNKNRD